MQVILVEDVKSLGAKGQAVEVSEGYARNFLFPAHLALEGVGGSGDAAKNDQVKKPSKADEEARHRAAEIDGLEVVVPFAGAAVGPKEVRHALKELGYKVPEGHITMQPMKEPGTQEVTVNFDGGYEAVVSVTVEM